LGQSRLLVSFWVEQSIDMATIDMKLLNSEYYAMKPPS